VSRAGASGRGLLLDGFRRHDLLTYASAISFQILSAIIPFLLFVLGVAGSPMGRFTNQPVVRVGIAREPKMRCATLVTSSGSSSAPRTGPSWC
jgi:hypothetical protein